MVGTRKSLPSLALPTDIPAELRIDGKSTLLGEKRDEAPVRTYRWKGRVYELTADTPAEWLTEHPEKKKKRKRSPSPPPSPPPQKRKKSTTTTTTTTNTTEKKKRKTTTTASRAEETVAFDLSMEGAAEMKAAIRSKQEEAKKNGYRVEGLRDDEMRDDITVARPGREDEDDDDTPPSGIQLLQNIHAMSKLNSKIDKVKAKYEQMKQRGLSADALKKRKRATEEPEDEDILPGNTTKRARREETEDEDTTRNDEPQQVPTPDETDQESFMAQLQAAANETPRDDPDRETRSQLDSQLRSPSPDVDTTATPAADRTTPAEEADTSSSEVPPRRHASSVSMSISTGTSPSIHEAASAPAITQKNNTTTTRSSRPNDHFGKQQPRMPPPELAEKNRGGQTLRWSIKSEDITKNPERAESLIQKGRMKGESKQARRRRVAREMAFLQNLPQQEAWER